MEFAQVQVGYMHHKSSGNRKSCQQDHRSHSTAFGQPAIPGLDIKKTYNYYYRHNSPKTSLLTKLLLFFLYTFTRKDGKILVELDKIMYGYKEAAYWWNVTLVKTFLANGYKQMGKDKCVLVKSEGNKVSYCDFS